MPNSTTFVTERHTIRGYTIDTHSNPSNRAAIILVHGIGVSGRYFFPLAHELAKNFNVIVVDMPGSGDTIKPAEALSILELANILGDFMEQKNIVNATLVGHSMGCQTISMLAAQRPELCKKLILISPTINSAERSASKQLFRLLQDTTREPMNVNTIIFSDYLKYGFIRYLKTQRFMINDAIENRVGDYPRPALLIRGSEDSIAPELWVQQLVTCFPNATLRTVPGFAHAVHLTAHQQVATLCRSFIHDA